MNDIITSKFNFLWSPNSSEFYAWCIRDININEENYVLHRYDVYTCILSNQCYDQVYVCIIQQLFPVSLKFK